jgi:multidrug efflux pump subunit AcrA (membrane-fusion protein)
MIHKHIKSLPHHPKRVVVVSLIIALAIGTFGYIKINKKVTTPLVKDNSSINVDNHSSLPQNLTLGFLVGGRIKSISVKAGDSVKKGQVLATLDAGNVEGALTQAKATYETAKAGLVIAEQHASALKDSVVNVTAQQDILVKNAYSNLLNSVPEAIPRDNTQNYTAPTISGTYILGKEGTINLHFYYSSGGISFMVSGLTIGTEMSNTITPEPIGDSGLYLNFASSVINTADWVIEIPNKKAPNYLANYNAYQLALETRNKAIADAKASVGTTDSSSVTDAQIAQAQAQVDNAQGAVQIAEAAYNNTIIKAPSLGTIISVIITPGQIATPNAPAIEFMSSSQN